MDRGAGGRWSIASLNLGTELLGGGVDRCGLSLAEWLGMLRDLLVPLVPAPALGHTSSPYSRCDFATGRPAPAFPNRDGAQNPLYPLPSVLLTEQ